MTEREKELQRIREEAKARMENRVGALTRTEVLSKDAWRERVNAVSDESITQFLAASPTSSIPTFTQQKATNLSRAREAMGLSEANSLPTVKWGAGQPDRTIAERALSLPREDKTQAQQDVVSSFLFGKNNNKLNKDTGLRNGVGGAVGFLYGTILKSDEQEKAERYQKLIKQGVKPERAFQVATTWKDGVKPADITEAEESSMKWYTTGRNAFIGLELLDLLFVGKPVNIALKGMAKARVVKVFDVISKAENAAQARRLLAESYPEIANKEGVEDLINLARNMEENDSWRKTLADSATGRKLLDELPENKVAQATTEAQRIVYENGIPVLRAGRASENVNDIVSIRDEIRAAVKGEMEGRRLSSDDVLNDELRAGILKFGTDADSTVPVFATRNTDKLKLGERVALDPTVARESLQAGSDATKIMAKVDDLVRLDDGTFVYAPKKAVTEEFSPQIKAVQAQARQRVLEAEKRRAQLARDIKVTERQLAEADRRIARQQAEAVLKKEAEKLNIAKDVVENGDRRAAEVIEETTRKRDQLIQSRLAAKEKAAKEIADKKAKITQLVKMVGDANKARPKIVADTKKAIEKIKTQATFPRVRFGEEMPLKLQELETEVSILKDTVSNHPAAWLEKYIIKRGKMKGEFTDEVRNAQGRSMDDAVLENSYGRYNTLEEAKEGYMEYKRAQTSLKTQEKVLRERKAAWKASAGNRKFLNKEAYRTEKLEEARKAGDKALKQNMRKKIGVEGQIKTLREEINTIKKNTPELGQTKRELSKSINTVASVRIAGVKENLRRMKEEAKQVLEAAGETAEKLTRLKDDFVPTGSNQSVKEIKDNVKTDFEKIAKELGDTSFEVVDIEIIGSRVTGKSTEVSDLDIVVEFKGKLTESNVSDWVRNSDFETGEEIHSLGELGYGGLYTDIAVTKNPIDDYLKKDLELQTKAAPKKKRTPPPVRKESIEYTSAKSNVTKEYSKAGMMDDSVGGTEAGLKPLSGTDKQVVSQVNQRIQDEVSVVNELLEKAGVTTETLGIDPAYHRYAKNSVQREKAIEKIYSNPEGTYRDFISGKIDGDSALAFIGENLLDHPFVRNDNVRRLAVSKAMRETATGAAQQLQGYSAISKRSYSGIMKQLDDSIIAGMKRNGIDIEKEKNALRAEFDKIVSNYPTADPSDIVKEITRLTCTS